MNFEEHTNQISTVKSNIKTLEDQVKDLKTELEGLEYQLIRQMDEVGLDRIRTEAGSFSRSTRMVYNISDFDAFSDYILESKNVSLFQRRASAKAIEEILQSGEIVPGIQPVELDKLNFRSN